MMMTIGCSTCEQRRKSHPAIAAQPYSSSQSSAIHHWVIRIQNSGELNILPPDSFDESVFHSSENCYSSPKQEMPLIQNSDLVMVNR
jgi:hypothetical protein